jgi:hypothetical protein
MFNSTTKSVVLAHPFSNKGDTNGINNDSWAPIDPIQNWIETTNSEKQQLLHDLRDAYPHFNEIRMDSMRLRVAELPFYASSGFRCYRRPISLMRHLINIYCWLAPVWCIGMI